MTSLIGREMRREIAAIERLDPDMAFVLDVYCRLGEQDPISEREVSRAVDLLQDRLGVETYRGGDLGNTVALDAYMASIHQGVLLEELTTPGTGHSVLHILDMMAGGVTAGAGWRKWNREHPPRRERERVLAA